MKRRKVISKEEIKFHKTKNENKNSKIPEEIIIEKKYIKYIFYITTIMFELNDINST